MVNIGSIAENEKKTLQERILMWRRHNINLLIVMFLTRILKWHI